MQIWLEGEEVLLHTTAHTLQIWDLRNMRSPMDSVRLDCGVNRYMYRLLFKSDIILLFILDFFLVPRLAVSHDDRGILAVPLDNRHIKLYDLKGSRLAHSSKNSRTVSFSLSLPSPQFYYAIRVHSL